MQKEQIAQAFRELQADICQQLESCDGLAQFQSDLWQREGGGGGDTRIIRKGNYFEKGGVNFSEVHGALSDTVKTMLKSDAESFYATGVSIVIHPNNPWVPIIHMNIRYFEMPDTGKWWFGGGIDLTPHYVNTEEAAYFHGEMKKVCDEHDENYYARFKEWADNYFYIPHREETRGIGGIFFDHLNTEGEGKSKEELFDFVINVGRTFAPTYIPLVEANAKRTFGEKEKLWQQVRRGRYVEFNLVYDRGTTFGLKTNGRVESILMSLPETAGWHYQFTPKANSLEEQTMAWLRKGVSIQEYSR